MTQGHQAILDLLKTFLHIQSTFTTYSILTMAGWVSPRSLGIPLHLSDEQTEA